MAVTKVTPDGLSAPKIGANLLINGACNVAQRGTVTGLGGTNGARTAIDMWLVDTDGSSSEGRFTSSQDSTSPTGFGNSHKIDTTTAESAVATGDLINVQMRNEAQTLQHLKWGTSSAESIQLSFWFRSPKTGTHCVSLYAQDSNRSMVKEFTIDSADTFEYQSLTFTGDTGGTAFADDTGAGFFVSFPLVCGSNYQISADTWTANNRYATSNQQNLLDNTSNNIYISGVSMIVGTLASSDDFEHEDYNTTLRKCQRYLHYHTRASSVDHIFAAGKVNTTTTAEFVMLHPVTMRAAPTLGGSASDDFGIRHANTTTTTTNLTNVVSGPNAACVLATVSSGLTAGQGALLFLGSDGDYIQWAAEL